MWLISANQSWNLGLKHILGEAISGFVMSELLSQ
jgi:hypothetical protein